MIEENKKTKNKNIKRVIIFILIFITLCVLIITPIIFRGYRMYQKAVNEISIQQKILEVKADDSYATLDKISPLFLLGVLESEDQSFYRHNGIDYKSTSRAIINNMKAGNLVEGGSSITQQLAKNLYFSFEKKFERKVAELFVVKQLEKTLEKNEILELYCNIAYFGEGNYGIEEATIYYFGVPPSEITEIQSDMLVKTLKSPSYYNPKTILENN